MLLSQWIQLSLAPGLGPRRVLLLLKRAQSQQDLFNSDSLYRACGISPNLRRGLNQVDEKLINQTLIWAEQDNHHLISLEHHNYPSLLAEISSPPLLLFIKGNAKLIAKQQIAIVGARKASHYGLESAKLFAKQLSQQNLIVTSGLAIGIDAAAHQAALDCNHPTIAVVGCGLNHVYPPQHRHLAQRIATTGALLSEFAPHIRAQARHFPQRNRIISGLSLGTLVVEAAARSGSLITAKQALEQNREVFAVPGNIHTAYARGCHELIQQGAKLAINSQDITQELGLPPCNVDEMPINTTDSSEPLAAELQKLVECVGFQSTSVDKIVNLSGLTAPEVCSMLLKLELAGLVKAVTGGYVRNPFVE